MALAQDPIHAGVCILYVFTAKEVVLRVYYYTLACTLFTSREIPPPHTFLPCYYYLLVCHKDHEAPNGKVMLQSVNSIHILIIHRKYTTYGTSSGVLYSCLYSVCFQRNPPPHTFLPCYYYLLVCHKDHEAPNGKVMLQSVEIQILSIKLITQQ